MKVLINTPKITELGGVANHYLGLQPFWNEQVVYNTIGTRNKIPGILLMPFDIVKFIIKNAFLQPDLIVLNPSLNDKALKRDAIYLAISKFFKFKTLVFFHGWNSDIESKIDLNPKQFLDAYKKSDAFFVLANSFALTLKSWGINKTIYLTTTKVNDLLLENFLIKNRKTTNCNLLFLSRIEKEKGVFIALEAFKIIKKQIPNATLTVVGGGNALEDAKLFTKIENINDVIFTGALNGTALIDAFNNSTIYLLPTQHGEGMPTSVLEAMAFGLPVISRPVGGLVDFFENEKMGYLVDSINPNDFAEKIILLLQDKKQLENISNYNYIYAKNNFLASIVSKKMEEIFIQNL